MTKQTAGVPQEHKADLLVVNALSMEFHGVHALNDVSFRVREGEIFSIIGPNGAGKTTLFNCINGFYKPTSGKIVLEGNELTRLKSHKIPERGIARTFQNIELFKRMTVLDNIRLGAHIHLRSGILTSLLYYGKAEREELALRKKIEDDIIDLLEIASIRHKPVASLSYGLQKRVELARALAAEPKLLMLDEPTAGMNVEETQDMVRYILDIAEEKKITIMLIEHDMGVVMDISDKIVVLDFGNKIAQGTSQEVKTNQAVIDAYLGEEHAGPDISKTA